MGLFNRMRQLGWKSRFVNGAEVLIPPSKKPQKKRYADMSKYRSVQRLPAGVDDVELLVVDEVMSANMPALFDYLTVLPDDAPKNAKTASLTIFVEEGQFKICLNDRVYDLVTFVSGDTFQETLSSLERSLSNGSADWRASKRSRK